MIEVSGVVRSLEFQLVGHAVHIPDHTPHYEEIAGIVKANQPFKAGLSPRSESIIPVTEYVPVYKFEHDGHVILTYPEKVQDAQFLIYVLLFLGVTITFLGAWSLYSVKWQNNLSAMRESDDPKVD
ncbi:MAG: hypothetical protein JST89_04305 [Cyanobacteria bacterium SZAS-4]|nr:hypothetical protein [Cyanobacteria bacterium SZAS-4]